MDSLTLNLERVRERIAAAARRGGRDAAAVRLIAVTKTRSVETVRAIRELGVVDIGENRVEEAVPKIEALAGSGIVWHMIGHVQSRKARPVAECFDVVHSLDGLKLARRLNGFAGERGRTLPVLLECNVSGEASKEGWPAGDPARWDALRPEIEAVLACPHLRVRGLMTMAPIVADPEQARPFFVRLRRLRDFLAGQFPSTGWSELSMGMTDDFEVAVEEGATMVRVGRALFGDREI